MICFRGKKMNKSHCATQNQNTAAQNFKFFIYTKKKKKRKSSLVMIQIAIILSN